VSSTTSDSTYASPKWSWLILACIFVASFLVRRWFNTRCMPHTCAKAGPAPGGGRGRAGSLLRHSGAALGFDRLCRRGFGDLRRREADRRSAVSCLSLSQAAVSRFGEAPKGVIFDTPAQIKRLAPQIMVQAVKTTPCRWGTLPRSLKQNGRCWAPVSRRDQNRTKSRQMYDKLPIKWSHIRL
jgi:hypothetical protein